MAEEIKSLIEKIQKEGVERAQSQAEEIEARARKSAEEILAKAKQEADKIISAAKEEQAKQRQSGQVALQQAARDMLIALKDHISATLEKIIVSEVQAALSTRELGDILAEMIKSAKNTQEITVSLNKKDLEALEKNFLNKLKDELKKGVTLRASDDIRAGFTISFDAGKSCFDFSDRALGEYIAKYIKPKLAGLLE